MLKYVDRTSVACFLWSIVTMNTSMRISEYIIISMWNVFMTIYFSNSDEQKKGLLPQENMEKGWDHGRRKKTKYEYFLLKLTCDQMSHYIHLSCLANRNKPGVIYTID